MHDNNDNDDNNENIQITNDDNYINIGINGLNLNHLRQALQNIAQAYNIRLVMNNNGFYGEPAVIVTERDMLTEVNIDIDADLDLDLDPNFVEAQTESIHEYQPKMHPADPNTILNFIPSTNLVGECPICLENNTKEDIVESPCGHQFHRNCIVDWFEHGNFCPVCRATL